MLSKFEIKLVHFLAKTIGWDMTQAVMKIVYKVFFGVKCGVHIELIRLSMLWYRIERALHTFFKYTIPMFVMEAFKDESR